MSSHVSVMTLAIGCATAAVGNWADSGISSEAVFLRESMQKVARSTELSQALFGLKASVIERIHALRDDCNEQGWDGYEALPMSKDAVCRAEAFMRALPTNLPMPELTAETDGSIALEWGTSPVRSLSLSIGTSDRLPYAWIDGVERGHAVAGFDGAVISPQLLGMIKGVAERGATVRAG